MKTILKLGRVHAWLFKRTWNRKKYLFLCGFVLLAIGFGGISCCRNRTDLRSDSSETKKEFQQRLLAAKGNIARLDRELDEEIYSCAPLLEEGFAYRAKMVKFARRLQAECEEGEPLSGKTLDQFNLNVKEGFSICQRVFRLVDIHGNWRELDMAGAEAAGLSVIPLELRVKGTMFSLAGSLFLYDTYRLHVATLAENSKTRSVLEHGDKGYGINRGLIDDITEQFLSLGNRLAARAQYKFCREHRALAEKHYGDSPVFRALCELIDQSPSVKYFSTPVPLLPIAASVEHTDVRLRQVRSELENIAEQSVGTLSKYFGNTVGLVEFRKGKLYKSSAVHRDLEDALQPGDILLEKTPFRLTDSFIPGFWGHAAIYVGNEDQLRRLGLWDDPLVRPHQEEIREGRVILEALRGGIMLNPIADFLNIDDLSVLRQKSLSRKQQRRIVRLGLRQFGKEYDFNFDVETTDKIVCSELIYVSFTDIKWPTEKSLGRYTISPDNIANKLFDEAPFTLVLLYNDGKKVEKELLPQMAQLLKRGKEEMSDSLESGD